MKKWLSALLALVCILACSLHASAFEDTPVDESTYSEQTPAPIAVNLREGAAGRGAIEDIYQYWEDNGYPEDISFAYKADGEVDGETIYAYWEIGMVGADETRKQEILDLMAPTCLVTFHDCTYTYGQKLVAYSRLRSLEDENILQVIFVRNADNIVVAVPESVRAEYTGLLEREYGFGSLVSVVDETGIGEDLLYVPHVTNLYLPAEEPDVVNDAILAAPASFHWSALLVVLVILLGSGTLLFRNRLRSVFAVKTTNGSVVASAPLDRKQVVKKIRKSEVTPDADLLEAIWRRIDSEEI